MGYETKLIIGTTSSFTDGHETWFDVYATIDLCKCGYDSSISEIKWRNTNKERTWYWYENGDNKITEDLYGESSIPVPIKDVISALEKDVASDNYRRFKWALSLLKSMANDSENICVMFFGH